jgi:hypothetical protein
MKEKFHMIFSIDNQQILTSIPDKNSEYFGDISEVT